ncbi:MAG: hypothetical protein FD163_880 [Hyphomonadaceae bacterium]|nr:MAG: hypothetical protein FD128_2012 [Hyphomonadaceae bacterium]KAF0186212.1 MAG: hypothetical protein FD163_880 [Hyphomonadaceae bacterium]
MNLEEATSIIIEFNNCITTKNLHVMAELLSDDHQFIDAVGNVISGKRQCLQAWQQFFELFPDYQNQFDEISFDGDYFVIHGRSICADARLAGAAKWKAKVKDQCVTEWQVLATDQRNDQHDRSSSGT